ETLVAVFIAPEQYLLQVSNSFIKINCHILSTYNSHNTNISVMAIVLLNINSCNAWMVHF
ncbi:hypothetical protein, partial [Leuconostoc falkenbergense]|uniref:hypothetical protein n=1 Tax=Leuconostoc falkenbergense TaxID=2766470 RepID=UPI003BAE56A9